MKNKNYQYKAVFYCTIGIFLILASLSATAQHGYIATEVDFRNTILQQSEADNAGYNGTIKLGYSSSHFQAEGFAELYPNIDYTSLGMNVYYVFTPENKLRPLIGLQLSTINRNSDHQVGGHKIYGKLNASFGVNAALEWHLTEWLFASARWEMKYRSDLQTFEEQKDMEKPFVNYVKGSGFVGLGIKLFNKKNRY